MNATPRITHRPTPPRALASLQASALSPLMQRLYAARGIDDQSQLQTTLAELIPPTELTGSAEAAVMLADAIAEQQKLLIVADYDCDGATACALGMRALRSFGAKVDYLVPNRFEFGYGLTPAIVKLAAEQGAKIIITVDNGIASVEGVEFAQSLGIGVLITDHHLPGDTLPEADVIVNPNQPGCFFPSKALAGVGVIFYTMLALRAELRERGHFQDKPEPNLAQLLDLVALGTVADVVPLDRNNRILVTQGLERMRRAQCNPGILALFAVAGREVREARANDLGFALGPRLNAAGRLEDMSLGIDCLISDDYAHCTKIAQRLNELNHQRRDIEADMQQEAQAQLAELEQGLQSTQSYSVCLYQEHWHEGIIGIVAGRVREQTHRPSIVFAKTSSGELKGSGRSITGVHLRDMLDIVSKKSPVLIHKFGGHAMAAGLTIGADSFNEFAQLFEATLAEQVDEDLLKQTIRCDGPLTAEELSLGTAQMLQKQVWGQHFPEPLFDNIFQLKSQRLLKDKHLKLQLQFGSQLVDAIYFNYPQTVFSTSGKVRLIFRLDSNEYQQQSHLQLIVEHLEAAD